MCITVYIYFSNPSDDQVFELLDNQIELNQFLQRQGQQLSRARKVQYVPRELEPFRVSQLIDSCHKNNSIYQVLRLSTIYDIQNVGNMAEQHGITTQLDGLIASIKVDSNVNIWPDSAEDGLDSLAQSSLKDFDVDKYIDNVIIIFFLSPLSY